ncbi:condensation domain-containing protein [Streptosporangium sp. KLBMP 9127]|nr:condensation domain-containing protein [Streptosporangium sp. KLBMP 9127]
MTTEITAELAGLTPEERRLLLDRLRERRTGATGVPTGPRPRADADAPAPLSSAQERLWFLDRLDPGGPAYNIAFSVRLGGSLDRPALAEALLGVIRRHEVLRTAFADVDGEPRQVVGEPVPVPLPYTDLRGVPAAERAAVLRGLVGEHAGTRLDLASGAPIAVRLFAVGHHEHVLCVAAHHIVFDGWSTAVLAEELMALYAAATTGTPPELPEPVVQFADWAGWERTRLAGRRFQQQLAYWKRRLSGAPALSTLPADRPRPDRQTQNGAYLPFELPAGLAGELVTLAGQAGGTLNVAVLAGVAALVHRATGQEDVLLAVSVAGRTHTDLEALIGCFADTVVLRVDLSGDPTLLEVVGRTRKALGDALGRQDVPYARVVEEVAPPRSPSHNPLAQIMLSIADLPDRPRTAGGLTFAVEQLDSDLNDQLTDFDLYFALSRADGGLRGVVGYNTDLYLRGTADDAIGGLREILTEMATWPDRTLREAASLRRATISVAATFTADPVLEPLDFWFRFLRMPTRIEPAPYGQVIQHLLAGGDADATIVLFRWEDWLRHHDLDASGAILVLERALEDLAGALEVARNRSTAPITVGITPPSEEYAGQPWTGLFARLEDRFVSRCRGLADVVPASSWTRWYPTATVGDRHADELGHVPYVPEFFAAIGTRLAREVYRGRARPVRTVLLDPARVRAGAGPGSPAAEALDRLLTTQERLGRQVVRCEPGTPADPARRLAELAGRGGLDPATCVILDPDPAVLDRARAAFPAVLTLRTPARPRSLPRYLDHLWALDGPVRDGGEVAFDGERLGYLAGHLTDASVIAERARPAAGPAADPGAESVPPRTATEERLADLWRAALRTDEVGVTTGFFALGGHSLLATQLLSQVHREFGKHVSLPAFLAQPTIERLAVLVDAATDEERITPAAGEPVVSATQERLWALARLGDESARHNITFAARLRGELDRDALRRAVEEIPARHEALRTTFAEENGRPVPVVHARQDSWLPDLDLTRTPPADGDVIERHVREHAALHLDLDTGPLVRARLIRSSAQEHHLLISIHHIVSDAWSWGIYLRELGTLYEAFSAGLPSPLPPPPLRFADYAAWQRDRLDGAASQPHVAYWRNRLAGAPALYNLPTDRPRPAVRSDRSACRTRTFGAGLGTGLRALSSAEGVSLFSTLLAGFGALLQRHSQDDDLVVGVPVAGRDRAELAELIGYFADILPFRLDLAERPTFRELIRRTHARVMEAHQHQHLPFSRIVEAAGPDRDPAFHPLFQSMFNFLDQPEHRPVLGELTVTPLDVPPTGTDFDLFLTLSWQGDRLHASLDHSVALFDPETADRLLSCLETLLAAGLAEPDQPVDTLDPGPSFVVSPHRPAPLHPAGSGRGLPVAVAASFTAEPLRAAAEHWLRVAELPASVEFAPYAQLFQQLVDPAGLLGAADDGVNVVLLRWEDWLRYQNAGVAAPLPAAVTRLEQDLHDLFAAVRGFRERSRASLVIGVCPPSPRYAGPEWSRLFGGLLERLERFAGARGGVTVASMDQWIRPYQVTEVCDERADELGHMPYTAEYYAVLGTAVARQVCRLAGRRTRTIVLDPERTLLGPAGEVAATGWQRELLRFLRGQLRSGRRLALCSSGARDLTAGLPASGGLPVHADEVVARREGAPLAVLLAGLAEEGLVNPDECLVLDPDPAECVAVREAFPGLPAVLVPTDPRAVRAALAHVWPLDLPAAAPTADAPVSCGPAPCAPTDARSILEAIGTGRAHDAHTPYRAPRTERERILGGVWADLLNRDRVGIDDDFFELGGDSLQAIQAVSLAAKAGIAMTPRQLLEHPTVAALAALDASGPAAGQRGPDAGPTPLTPAQRWFFSVIAPGVPNPSYFNHPYYLELREPVDPGHLRSALDHLVAHHDALRLRFTPDGAGGWTQAHVPAGPVPFTSHDLSGVTGVERDRRLAELGGAAQAALDLTDGPIIRAVHFRLGGGAADRLLIVPHHIVVDGMSRGILLDDLQALCRAFAAGGEPSLPARTTSLQHWSRRLAEHAGTPEVRAELPFWLAQGGDDGDERALPPDFPGGVPTGESYETLMAQLDEPGTDGLRELARDLGMRLGELLVGVVGGWLTERTGREDCTIAVAGHGREDLFEEVDLSRTVGWFQVYYPVLLRSPGAGLPAVRRQLAQVPHNGIGFSLLRFCSPDAETGPALAAMPTPQVSVNFMGDFSFVGTPTGTDLFDVPEGECGPAHDPNAKWIYPLDFVCSVVDRKLTVELAYSRNFYRPETARGALREVIAALSAASDRSA